MRNITQRRHSTRGSRRAVNPHVSVIPSSYEMRRVYTVPKTWDEMSVATVPLDAHERSLFLQSLNELIERALFSREPVPISVQRTCTRLHEYHVFNRTRIINREKHGRQSSELMFMIHARLRFLLFGASWNESTTCGGQFMRLCRRDTSVVIDAHTPIIRYSASKLRLALFKVSREWTALQYSDELVSYVDHLHRRVCMFLTCTFPKRVHNYNKWRHDGNDGSNRRFFSANSYFLTIMDIYFSSLQVEMLRYERMKRHVSSGGIRGYRTLSKEVLERAIRWMARAGDEVYETVVLEELRKEYVETRIHPGERELYGYENSADGMSQTPQSVISAFRASELEMIELTADMKISNMLDPNSRVGDDKEHAVKRPRGDRSRELIMLCILQFMFRSKFRLDFRDFYWIRDKDAYDGGDGDLSTSTVTATGAAVEIDPNQHPLHIHGRARRPVIVNVFHQLCVFWHGHGGLFLCGNSPIIAICCWLELMVTQYDDARVKRGCDPELPGLKPIYEHIFNGKNYVSDQQEANIARIYGQSRKNVAIWSPSPS